MVFNCGIRFQVRHWSFFTHVMENVSFYSGLGYFMQEAKDFGNLNKN